MEIFSDSFVGDCLDKFKQLTKKPEYFLEVQKEVGKELKHLLKNLYDYTKSLETISSCAAIDAGSALPELIVKHFDEEQIWQELELQNVDKCNKFIANVSLLLAQKDHLNFYVRLKNNKTDKTKIERRSKEDDEVTFESVKEDANSTDDLSDGFKVDEEGEAEADNTKDHFLEENEPDEPRAKGKVKIKPSIVDDLFFKLKKLEAFLENEERKENENNKRSGSHLAKNDEDDDEESIDYFQGSSSDEEEGEEDHTDTYYQDFFDPPDMENNINETERKVVTTSNAKDVVGSDYEPEEGDQSETEKQHDEKQVRFNLMPASTGSDSSETEDDDHTGFKSSFEARQERLKLRIKQLEEEALAEKPWQLKGEVAAAARPQNSLLEEIVEFDLTTRPAPVVTEKTTVKLEDIIRQRIKDKAWDDVERKIKPVQAPNEYKKQLVMDQEKSKLSLAEVYEQEYIKQREAQDPSNQEKPEEEPKEHHEVRAMMSALFAKLDALSNFHYTPKPVAPEIKVISNLPAISMEEVAPVATSDAALLAPEEVKAKPKGDVLGITERTKTDKKRERRRKKAMQRQRHKERENRVKTVEKLKPGLGNKYSKERALQMLEKVAKDKNVEQMADMGKDKGVRSSTAFFARLQEEVSSHIKAFTEPHKRKTLKNNITAKKIKL